MHVLLIGWSIETGHAGAGGLHVGWGDGRFRQCLRDRRGQVGGGLFHTDDMIVGGAALAFAHKAASVVGKNDMGFGCTAVDSKIVGHREIVARMGQMSNTGEVCLKQDLQDFWGGWRLVEWGWGDPRRSAKKTFSRLRTRRAAENTFF